MRGLALAIQVLSRLTRVNRAVVHVLVALRVLVLIQPTSRRLRRAPGPSAHDTNCGCETGTPARECVGFTRGRFMR